MSDLVSTKAKGLQRDKKIVLTIEEYQALERTQIQALLFPGMPQGKRKSQQRLQSLYNAGKLNRTREAAQDYVYYLDAKPGLLKHLIGVNWVRLWMCCTLPSWEIQQSWSYEQDYKVLRCDGFATIKNTMANRYRFAFVELDRGTNAWDKVAKYNQLYANRGYTGRWWVKLTDRFPPVFVATSSPVRRRKILDLIENYNVHGLEFDVRLLDDLREECIQRWLPSPMNGLKD